MADDTKRAKNDNPLLLYRVHKRHRRDPSTEFDFWYNDPSSARKLVSRFYEQVKGPGGYVNVKEAKDSRVANIAVNLCEKAHKTYENLARKEELMLNGLVNISQAAGDRYRQEDLTERLCIQMENFRNTEISDRVESVANQVLGRGLRLPEEQAKEYNLE